MGESLTDIPLGFLSSWADEQGFAQSGARGVAGNGNVHHANGYAEDVGSRDDCWVSGTGAFIPMLKLVEEFTCSCAMAGEYADGESLHGVYVTGVVAEKLGEGGGV